LDKDRAGIVAVQVAILPAIAVERQVFHMDVIHIFGAEDRKDSRSSGAIA